MSGLEKLTEQLKEDIKRFDEDSKKHKSLHRRSQTALIFLTASTTIVSGLGLLLPESKSKAIQFAVLCLTAVSVSLSAWSEMRRARDLWQHEREVFYALKDIQREMEFSAANKGLTPADLDALQGRIAAVLDSSARQWARLLDKKAAESAASPGRGGS